MLQISNVTKLLCGVILITVPTIEFGGVFLLKMLRTREVGYMDNPIRQNLFSGGTRTCGCDCDSVTCLPDAGGFDRTSHPARLDRPHRRPSRCHIDPSGLLSLRGIAARRAAE